MLHVRQKWAARLGGPLACAVRYRISLKDKDRKEENSIINLVLEVLRILINLLD